MFRPRVQNSLLFLFLLIPVLVSCSSASTTPPETLPAPTATQAPPAPTPTPEPHYKVGDQVTVGSWAITIEAYSSSGDTSYTPKSGSVLLIVTVKQQNHGNQSATANGAADWSLRDSSGATFPLIPQSAYGTFPQDNVAAGETATGALVYEVPGSKDHFLLIFNPASGGNRATWDITRG